MTYSYTDFALTKNGPQFTLLMERLIAHGYGPTRLTMSVKECVQRFQLAQGWTGSGADGLVGPKTWARLLADPPEPGEIDLSIWKLTLPVDENDNDSPDEVYPIGAFSKPPWFYDAFPDGMVFRANCGGAHTPNSEYPRCELREMKPGGAGVKAGWSTTVGVNEMSVEQAITHLPVEKPEVVAGQIHDAADDVVMCRLEGKRLFIEHDGNEMAVLSENYVLGTRFRLTFRASNGQVRTFYNGVEVTKALILGNYTGCYFKAGCYTQSNVEHGDEPDAYGEVVIYDLKVRHAA